MHGRILFPIGPIGPETNHCLVEYQGEVPSTFVKLTTFFCERVFVSSEGFSPIAPRTRCTAGRRFQWCDGPHTRCVGEIQRKTKQKTYPLARNMAIGNPVIINEWAFI